MSDRVSEGTAATPARQDDPASAYADLRCPLAGRNLLMAAPWGVRLERHRACPLTCGHRARLS